jgi:ketosteroid isomerase-like protein
MSTTRDTSRGPDLDVVRGLYDSFARRDLDAIRAAIAADFTMTQTDQLPWGGTRQGPDGFFGFLGTLLSHIDPTLEIEQLIDAGDHIVEIGHSHGTVLAHGNTFRVREIHVWTVSDSLVTSYRVYVDTPAMLAALRGETFEV